MKHERILFAIALGSACVDPDVGTRSGAVPTERARHGELVVTAPDGTAKRSHELVGAIITFGELTLRLDAVRDESKLGGDLVLHHLVIVDDEGTESELCEPDPDGERWALSLPYDQGRAEFVCTSGARGKCARAGYWPGEPATAELHAACVRMLRADYGGDGSTATRDGTRIAFCDRAGLRPCAELGQLAVEAAWSSAGAVCVARPRIAELATLEQLETRYPSLLGHLGSACTLDSAWNDPRTGLISFVP